MQIKLVHTKRKAKAERGSIFDRWATETTIIGVTDNWVLSRVEQHHRLAGKQQWSGRLIKL